MSPSRILESIVGMGINLVAITDHNATLNSVTLGKMARKRSLPFFYGIEVQTQEEAHFLVYFDDLSSFELFGKEIYDRLPQVKNDPQHFGDQVAVDEEENVIYFEEKLLLNSVAISVEGLSRLVTKMGGLVIPAHVDSFHFSLPGQLGFIPPELHFPALEVSHAFLKKNPSVRDLLGYPLVSFSDAHYPEEIGKAVTVLQMESPTLEELRYALEGKGGRGIIRLEIGREPLGNG